MYCKGMQQQPIRCTCSVHNTDNAHPLAFIQTCASGLRVPCYAADTLYKSQTTGDRWIAVNLNATVAVSYVVIDNGPNCCLTDPGVILSYDVYLGSTPLVNNNASYTELFKTQYDLVGVVAGELRNDVSYALTISPPRKGSWVVLYKSEEDGGCRVEVIAVGPGMRAGCGVERASQGACRTGVEALMSFWARHQGKRAGLTACWE